MRQSVSLKSQDVAILLKLAVINGEQWRQVDISVQLQISQGEIAKSLSRLRKAGLITGKRVNRSSVIEFLVHGLKYMFPAEVGPLAVGVPTAISSPLFKGKILQEEGEVYVWPSDQGDKRGQVIMPFYPQLAEAALKDESFYELLAAVEVLRVGRAREKKLAEEEIRKRLSSDNE